MSKQVDIWKSSSGYIWAMIGSAVGFANILSFSAKCYYNGGGAFLIPLFIAFFLLGIPLLILEGIIGQYFRLPLVCAYGCVLGRWGKFLGWLSVATVTTIGGYYTVLTGWSIAYAYFFAIGSVPADTASFFMNTFLGDSGSLTEWGTFSFSIFLFTLLAAFFTWFVTVRNVRDGIERVCSFFMPLLTLFVILFALFVGFLPGAMKGFSYYLIPDFTRLADPKLWLYSFGQIFFSLSLALGIVVGYSRHTDSSVNIARSMLWVALGDLFISIISGFAIFGCIGYISHVGNISFDSVVTPSTFGLGFVVFPKILQLFKPLVTHLVGPLFFFCLFVAGITGVFSIVESIAGNIEVEFGFKRNKAVTVSIIAMVGLSLLFCGGNVLHIIEAIEPMTAGFSMIIGGIAEVIVFMYGSKLIMNHVVWFTAKKARSFYYYSLKYLVPLMLFFIFIGAFWREWGSGFNYIHIVRWSWLVGASGLSLLFSCKKSLS